MGNQRENYSAAEHSILYAETNGICPLCGCPLMITKSKFSKPTKVYELAHIYPLNPTPHQEKILIGYPKPSQINSLENILALCPSCHSKYDKDFKLDELKNLQLIKKRFLDHAIAAQSITQYQLQGEIYQILDKISDFAIDNLTPIQIDMNISTVEQKLKNGMDKLQVHEIKRNAAEYYVRIKEYIKLLEQNSQIKVRLLQNQIHTYYLYIYDQHPNNKDLVFNYIVDWIMKKSNKSPVASRILVAFFIQNCEIFDADTN